VSLLWNIDARLALNGLNPEPADMGIDQRFFERGDVIILYNTEAWHERTEIATRVGVSRCGNDCSGTSVKVIANCYDYGLVGRNVFPAVAPLPRELYRRLIGFRAAVHKQGLLITKGLANILLGDAEFIVVEGARSKR